jgi:hypothetical protein
MEGVLPVLATIYIEADTESRSNYVGGTNCRISAEGRQDNGVDNRILSCRLSGVSGYNRYHAGRSIRRGQGLP